MMPRTTDRIADQQAINQRCPVVRAYRTDGKQLSALTDKNGGLTSDGVNTYAWNARDQLTLVKAASTGTTLANFQYDAFGRRIENTAGDALLYDGVNAVQELSGTTPVVNRLTGGVDQFFSRTDSAGTTFPLTDALDSTIALTDSSGAIRTQYAYEPFGATTTTGATSSNSYQFTGRENDGTGLYYYRARYYSSRFQRFISEDPLGVAGGDNWYAYAGNNPVDFLDPSGLKPRSSFGGGAGTGETGWDPNGPNNPNNPNDPNKPDDPNSPNKNPQHHPCSQPGVTGADEMQIQANDLQTLSQALTTLHAAGDVVVGIGLSALGVVGPIYACAQFGPLVCVGAVEVAPAYIAGGYYLAKGSAQELMNDLKDNGTCQ